jgi:hypothetical protein
MRLVAADLAAALRDQPAVEEAIAWAAVASAVVVAAAEAAGAEAAGAAEVDADKTRSDSSIASVANVSTNMTFSKSL